MAKKSVPSFTPHMGRPLFMAGLVFASGWGLTGCNYFRSLGTGTRWDPQTTVHKPLSTKERHMEVEVITDAAGQVVAINFKRSSGSQAVDGYVRESIRSSWPPQSQPNTRTTVALTYSPSGGFSEPTMVSAVPVAAQ